MKVAKEVQKVDNEIVEGKLDYEGEYRFVCNKRELLSKPFVTIPLLVYV